MLKGADDAAFGKVMEDLCLAFNRPYSPELGRVFWEALKYAHIAEVQRKAKDYQRTGKKFPTPNDLMPERKSAPVQKTTDNGPQISKWAIAANKLLLESAYRDKARGFRPMGKYASLPDKGWGMPVRPILAMDAAPLQNLLRIKADYVQMAEQAERDGEPMDGLEFSNMCRDGFAHALRQADQQGMR